MSDESKVTDQPPCAALCPKCGSEDIHRQFRQKGVKWDAVSKEAEPLSNFINNCGLWRREATKDCITHHCRTCQYDWQTKPLRPKKLSPTAENAGLETK